MRLSPAQIGVHLICGQGRELLRHRYPELEDRLAAGRAMLVSLTGRDYAFDLAAWHDHLKESREGGYTWSRAVELPRIMKDALRRKAWREAATRLTAGGKEAHR